MEGESDFVDGCSFSWEVGMKVIKAERASLELRDQFAVTKPQISEGEPRAYEWEEIPGRM